MNDGSVDDDIDKNDYNTDGVDDDDDNNNHDDRDDDVDNKDTDSDFLASAYKSKCSVI